MRCKRKRRVKEAFQGFCSKPIFICQKAGRICEKQLKKKSEFLFLGMLILMCLLVIYQIKRVALTRQSLFLVTGPSRHQMVQNEGSTDLPTEDHRIKGEALRHLAMVITVKQNDQ